MALVIRILGRQLRNEPVALGPLPHARQRCALEVPAAAAENWRAAGRRHPREAAGGKGAKFGSAIGSATLPGSCRRSISLFRPLLCS